MTRARFLIRRYQDLVREIYLLTFGRPERFSPISFQSALIRGMETQVFRRLPHHEISLSRGTVASTGRNSSDRREVIKVCPRICIGGMKENRPVVTVEEVGVVRGECDLDCPVIRLNLRKPRNWNWKLTTSSSSPSVIFPVIRLVDDNGNVLHDDADKANESPTANRNINQCFTSQSAGASVKAIRGTAVEQSNYQGDSSRVRENGFPIRSAIGVRKVKSCSSKEESEDSARHSNPKLRGRHRDKKAVKSESTERRAGGCDLLREATPPPPEGAACRESAGNDRGGGCKTDGQARGKHRQSRKLDSGYKSLRIAADDAELCDKRKATRLRRKERSTTSSEVRGSSSSSGEDADNAARIKKMHRRARVVGDRLLSINGQDARFYEQAADLLRSSPDVVRLRLSHRRPSESCRHDCSTGSPISTRRSAKRRQQRRHSPLNAPMGSNVSRHSEKGLSGRRTQSSGNLCNGNKQLARDVGRILSSCSNVGPKDRNKFCGSLPNHLDGEYGDNELEEECCNNNNGDAYVTPRMNGDVPTAATATLKNQKNGVELRLAPHHDTALQDQGYGSERSPEDEHLPPLPDPDSFWALEHDYPFVTADASFEVTLTKGNRGLGLSVSGGVDTAEQWPGLIRIKRLFPHQPAWESGQLNTGDVLLAANGVALTGLTNYQALEVLRTTPSNVVLAVCRPPGDVFSVAAPSEPPPPPRRDPALSVISSRILTPLPLILADEQYCGEFDITLTKVNRSLGFTLRKEDESVLGHYVRALVREPALSDGRIQPGDKIVAVNDMPMSPMTHEEAVSFLRQCGEHVKLRLYRDAAQTPVAALSPVDDGPAKPRPTLRQEAMDMLSDLAVRKLSPGNSSGSSQGLLRVGETTSPGTSPRRRRLTKTPSPDIQAVALDRLGHRYLATSSVGGSDCSRDASRNSTFVLSPREDCDGVDGDDSRPERPKFLDLCSEAGALSPGARKQRYVFASSEARSDDAWTLTSGSDDLTTIGSQCFPPGGENDGGLPSEPASLPPLSSNSSTSTAFSYRNPAYQSAHPACNALKKPAEEDGNEHSSDQDIPGRVFEEEGEGSRGLMKWKGVMFAPENGETESSVNKEPVDTLTGQHEILTVELNRGWNSRLGFSLQGSNGHTYISAIYSDSVAAKDGRLQANDLLLTVNDENVEKMSTAEIIDLLRKIRGSIGIRVLRKSGPNLQVSS